MGSCIRSDPQVYCCVTREHSQLPPSGSYMTQAKTSKTLPQNLSYHEVQVHCFKQDKAMYIKYYLTNAERKELISDCGDAACMLFEFYLRMVSKAEPTPEDFSDNNAASYFGWNEQKAKRNRLKLIKHKWFDTANFKYTDKRRGISFYVGKAAVPK